MRGRLNPERVLAAAIKIADESGIQSLTMRRLGETLGVEAMSLYNHVANKDALLDGIVDFVLGEIELPSPTHSWDVAIRKCAISAHEVMVRHPWACSLAMAPITGQGARVARMRYIEAILRCFREAGFSAQLAARGYHAVDSHILGFTMWELGHTMAIGNMSPEVIERLLAEVSSGMYPYLLEHAGEHERDDEGEPGDFEFGLDIVLDGLRRLYHEDSNRSARSRVAKRLRVR